ncbi:nickel pincer cofactor biosynthesis protein LarB [bacterium]|nr:MAG: nickel pincer cofactor biosynthesis protein LarB [bacterium]
MDETTTARLDHDRERRTGIPEVVLCERKSPDGAVAIMRRFMEREGRAIATRVTAEQAGSLLAAFPGGHHNALARMFTVGNLPAAAGRPIAVVCAGTSDLPVAEEAHEMLRALGHPVVRHDDVGVAGIHRTMAILPSLEPCTAVIAVAGMEGALASVLAGLIRQPVIAVPTSVGYGASLGGLAALLTMMNSCAPGICVVNIDAGFSAACVAHKFAAAFSGNGSKPS